MNILFVHEVDWLRKVVFEIHTLSELLSQRGHNVYAVDYESMWEQDGTWFSPTRTMHVNRAYSGAPVELTRPGFIKIPVVSRVSYSAVYHNAIRKILKDKKIDVVLLYSVPTNGLRTISVCRRLGVPVVFRSIDVLHRLVDNPVLSLVTRQLERVVYRRADKILTITPALSRYTGSLAGRDDHIDVVPLGIDTGMFQPLPANGKLRREIGFTEHDDVVVFAGTLPHFSGLDGFIRHLGNVHQILPDLRLLIIGDGVQRPLLERLIREYGLVGKVVITGLVAQERLPYLIGIADVCINPFTVSDTTRDIFPTKVLQYMACGKPVVSSPLDGMKAMGLTDREGVLYANGVDAMSQVVTAILGGERLGKAAREYAVQNHDYEVIVDRIESQLGDVVKRKRDGKQKKV